MSRTWCVVSACCALLDLHAQQADTTDARTMDGMEAGSYDFLYKPTHYLSLEVVAAYDASSLRNELITGLYKGQHLDRDLRERSAEALTDENRFGYEFSARMSYAWGELFCGNMNVRPRISVSHNDLLGIRFTD